MASMTGLDIAIDRKAYPAAGAAPERVVYRDFRLTVAPGSFVALLGPSGCGKTTLLNIVAGLDRDVVGHVRVRGGETAGEAPPSAPRLAYVFQNPRLLPWRTVRENVELALDPGQLRRGLADRFIDLVGLGEARDQHPERLSVGMQRRAALARAFATEPDILLMDEPFVSLDGATADRLRLLLLELLAARRATVLFVTHDTREAAMLADRIVEVSGAPARIVRDVAVDLDGPGRRDAVARAAVHARLFETGRPPLAAVPADPRSGVAR
jgi:ABC-type nitrate/sulfonate/bicarbonate transport system ATPase subunit